MMRAKMQVRNVERIGENMERLSLSAVTGNVPFGPNGEHEDNSYARWTPSGTISLDITNPALHGTFSQGQKFYVDFTRADE